MMKIFGELSGLCQLAVFSITARRYRALSEQFIFLSFISFFSLSLSLFNSRLHQLSLLKSITFLVIFYQIEVLQTFLIIFNIFWPIKILHFLQNLKNPNLKP